MELLEYLSEYFLTESELLKAAALDQSELLDFQDRKMMPQASYTLKVEISGDSFFGECQSVDDLNYYSKGYVAWLASIKEPSTPDVAFSIFSGRYAAQVEKLLEICPDDLIPDLAKLIKDEWDHFLNGTYGLCTKTGLPEDIATKEVAIRLIDLLTDEQTKAELSDLEKALVGKAVKLLDAASALFAPHERDRSSRERYINQVRAKYEIVGSVVDW